MSFAAFVSGVMEPTIQRSRAEQETKRRLEEHASQAKLDKALSEWEFYSPEERNAIAPELDKILKQKKGYSAELLGKGEQGYKFLKGALEQQKPIQSLEQSAQRVASQPINLGGTMKGPESLDAVNPGEFDQSPTPIQLPSKPVSLPPLPIEGSDIPRVDKNVLSLPPSQRALAAKDYRSRQAGMLERQSKVGEIQQSPLDPEDREIGIESIYLPPGVLSARERALMYGKGPGGAGSQVGLSTYKFVSPDGKKIISAQTTRTGQLIETGTGRVIPPEEMKGWTKLTEYSPQMIIQQSGHPAFINRTEINRQGLGTVVGEVPDVTAAETKTPLVDTAGNISGPGWGSRSGPPTATAPLRPVALPGEESAETPPPAAPPKPLRRTAVPLAEATQMATLDKDEEFVKSIGAKYKDEFVGPAQGRWDSLMADTPAPIRDIIGYKGTEELAAFRVANAKILNSVIKFITGAQMGEKEADRIKKEVPNVNQHPNDWWAAYNQTLDNIQMMKQRMVEMGRWPFQERGGQEAAPAPRSTQSPRGQGQGTPKVGDHKEFPNGNIGVWDGKGWKKVNPLSQ